MSKVLKATSKILNLDFNNYEEGRLVFKNKYIIKDSYSPAIDTQSHGEYIITLETSEIRNENDLLREASNLRAITGVITLLFKCVLGSALNTPERSMKSFTRTYYIPGEMPTGWSSNYDDVKTELEKNKTVLSVVSVNSIPFAELPQSPFSDLSKALQNYDRLSAEIKDLLSIINSADLVLDAARYMLLGKALEIVNSLYPLKGKADLRIKNEFPELSDTFGMTTIKDLHNLANNRKESRHYIKDKPTTSPHPSMTEDERKKFYDLINLLCISIVRKALGLETVLFEY